MYQVLLVDDEELDLEGMRTFIPWSQLGMEVKGCVNNALSANEIMDEHAIDILVSDINMPYMSGLELARIAMQRKPDLRIIFVSGYQEFSYVRQALSMNAYNYVLKPMDDNELVSTLLKVKRDLDEEGKRKEVEEAYRSLIPIAKNDFLIRLLEGGEDSEAEVCAKQLASYRLDQLAWPIRVAVAELDRLPPSSDKLLTQQEASRKFAELVHESLEQGDAVHYGRLPSGRIVFLAQEDRIGDMLAGLNESIARQTLFTVTTGLGEPVYGYGELASSYSQAISAVEAKMFVGKGNVIRYEAVSAEPEMLDFRELDERMNVLLGAITEYRLVDIYDDIDRLFRSIKGLRSRYTVHSLSNYIFWKLEQYVGSINENVFELLDIDIHNLDILLQFETIEDMRTWLNRRLFEMSEKLYEKSNTKEGKFIRSVIAALKERMHENITLKMIAQQFSFSPSYLGFLIKEKSGCTFSELLVQVRMEKACELLSQPGIKIYEIADRVGYRYLPYFSRQFKEKFGMTPLEYRRKEQ